MEIVEALIAVAGGLLDTGEGCLCFVQLVALLLDGSSVYTGVQSVRQDRRRREQVESGVAPPERNRYKLIFWVLLPLAACTTGLVIFTLVRGWQRRV